MAKNTYDIDENEVGQIVTFQATVSYFVCKIMEYFISEDHVYIDKLENLLKDIHKVASEQFSSDEKEANQQLYKDALQEVLLKVEGYDDFSIHCQLLEQQLRNDNEQIELVGKD